jgi:hypothetical protein
MSYLPDIYKHFERAFPTVHAAHQELARRCYEVGPLDERSAGHGCGRFAYLSRGRLNREYASNENL